MAEFADSVIHREPAVRVTRRRDALWAVEESKLLDVLQAYSLTMEYEQGEDGRYYGSLEEIPDIVGDGETVDELKESLAKYLIDYALGYREQLAAFYASPNRRKHFPFVLRVLANDSVEAVMELIS